MPRVSVQKPANCDVLESKRAFSWLRMRQDEDGEFDSLDSNKVEDYGDKAHLAALTGNLSFESLASALKKDPICGDAEGSGSCIGYAATGPKEALKPWKFSRRDPKPDDVVIRITYSGMCHSDVHMCRDEWSNTVRVNYPIVPGHEILGAVVATGGSVTRFKVGDFAAIGVIVDSCLNCKQCVKGEEHHCSKGYVMTYNDKDSDGNMTYGGYSSHIVCKEHFVLKISPRMHEPGTAPLLCAGITTFEPMVHNGLDKPGLRIGVVGLGGLGHMAVKFSKAFGQHCTVISRSNKKRDLALNHLGADAFLATDDQEAVAATARSLDAIIDTVAATHDVARLMDLLKLDGKLIFVGLPEEIKFSPFPIVHNRITVTGSFIGGIPMTQRCLDFCEEKGIRCDVEVVEIKEVNEAFDRMVAGDVKFRFVIDCLKSFVED